MLKPLFDTLKGDPDPNSSRVLTMEARQALSLVETAISQQQIRYCDYNRDWGLFILPTAHTPTAVLYQDTPLLWIHLNASPSKALAPYPDLVATLIATGRKDSLSYLEKILLSFVFLILNNSRIGFFNLMITGHFLWLTMLEKSVIIT